MKFHTVVSTTIVNTPIQKAWPELWRKAYQTKDFIPSLKDVIIHQKNDDQVLRTMMLGQLTVKERIVRDNQTHTVYFHNVSGSDFRGLIYNALYYNQKKELVLEFGSDAVGKDGQMIPNPEMFAKTMQRTKQIIEKQN